MTLRARIKGLLETSGMTATAARFGQGLGLWVLVGGPILVWWPPALGFPQLWLVVGLSLLANGLQPSPHTSSSR